MLSLSQTLQACAFRAGGHCFAVESNCVAEVLRSAALTRVPLAAEAIVGLLHLRGRIVPVIDMRRRLGFSAGPPDAVLSTSVGASQVFVAAACGGTQPLSKAHADTVLRQITAGDDLAAAKLCGQYSAKTFETHVCLAPLGVHPDHVGALVRVMGLSEHGLYLAAQALGAFGPTMGRGLPEGFVSGAGDHDPACSIAKVYVKALDDAAERGQFPAASLDFASCVT